MTNPIDSFLTRTHVAYFTMEIALRNEIHTYSGGLGVLAGDTARSCVDLQIPIVFVSLASRGGYLRQEIDSQGRQVDHPDPWNPADWAKPLNAMVAIVLEGRPVWIRPWLYEMAGPAGNAVPVILLDTDLTENRPDDREITSALYGGDMTDRLRQEAVLGIGGVRVLQALGFAIRTYHMNEGHSAFLTVELLRRNRSPETSGPLYEREQLMGSCIFTSHTPVQAAQDRFPYPTIERILGDFIELEELKRYAGAEECNMTQLALNLSGYVNGVAPRHAQLTQQRYPGYRVRAIANGVHTATWAHRAFSRLYDARFPHWSHEPEVLMRADQLDDAAVWDAHCEAKRDLVAFVNERTGTRLDPDVPIIGFARRMTGYKRPELLFTDIDRLTAICARQPFQVVLSGKAHPRDIDGKKLIEVLNRHVRELNGKIQVVFLPNYDLEVAAFLTSGTDIWLNTPLPPLEASGTSGMKAAINGVLNLSVLDGWWLEGWIEGVTGWAIGNDVPSENGNHAIDLYEKLETKVLPLYFNDRARWIGMMKQAISKLASHFTSQRMMRRYAAEAYLR